MPPKPVVLYVFFTYLDTILHVIMTYKNGPRRENPVFRVCEQQRPACASAQSDQHFCYRIITKLGTSEISLF